MSTELNSEFPEFRLKGCSRLKRRDLSGHDLQQIPSPTSSCHTREKPSNRNRGLKRRSFGIALKYVPRAGWAGRPMSGGANVN
jgi:hypothetical protein